MPEPIHAFVRRKLIRHGADRLPGGRIVLENKRVFLGFVRLERTVRVPDFDAVRSAVDRIEGCLAALGSRHLVILAYGYLAFPEKGARRSYDQVLEDGGMVRYVEYRRPFTAEERIIAEWGELRSKQCERLPWVLYAQRR